MKGPFCIVVKRVGGWWRVVGLFASRPTARQPWTRIARDVAGHCAQRHDAVASAKVLFNRMGD